MIECGSLDYAQARLQARHGQRLDEAAWRRIEVMREFAGVLELARTTALRRWLVGITAESTAHQIGAALRGHWRALVDELVSWMPGPWQAALAWCAIVPDLGPLQHLARGGEQLPWMQSDNTVRALCEAPPQARAAVLGAGPLAALAVAWPAPQLFGPAWLAEWRRRLPRPLGDADDALSRMVGTLAEHEAVFATAADGQGWLLRAALRERLALLLRRSSLEPAAAFIHLGLCALDMERLRSELLLRRLFARWKLT